MSIEEIGKFYEKVKNNAELQDKIMHMGAKTAEEALEVVTKIAYSDGFAFTKEELNAYAQQAVKKLAKEGELDEADLDAVAGGGTNEWVLFSVLSAGISCGLSLVGRESIFGCRMDMD